MIVCWNFNLVVFCICCLIFDIFFIFLVNLIFFIIVLVGVVDLFLKFEVIFKVIVKLIVGLFNFKLLVIFKYVFWFCNSKFVFFFSIVIISEIWLWLIFVVIFWGFLKLVGEINVCIFIKIGFVFFIEVIIVEFVILIGFFLRKILEGFKIFVRLSFFILKIFILFVELKWFFIVCKIWYVWCWFFLK